jgi:hypothetical protein
MKPTRCCLKKIGPGEVSLIITAIRSIRGLAITNAINDIEMSKSRLRGFLFLLKRAASSRQIRFLNIASQTNSSAEDEFWISVGSGPFNFG